MLYIWLSFNGAIYCRWRPSIVVSARERAQWPASWFSLHIGSPPPQPLSRHRSTFYLVNTWSITKTTKNLYTHYCGYIKLSFPLQCNRNTHTWMGMSERWPSPYIHSREDSIWAWLDAPYGPPCYTCSAYIHISLAQRQTLLSLQRAAFMVYCGINRLCHRGGY